MSVRKSKLGGKGAYLTANNVDILWAKRCDVGTEWQEVAGKGSSETVESGTRCQFGYFGWPRLVAILYSRCKAK